MRQHGRHVRIEQFVEDGDALGTDDGRDGVQPTGKTREGKKG